MSLVSNADNIAFASSFNIDKIVGVWEGSFNRATDVIERVGDAGSLFAYPIPHGLTRPVFVDLLFTTSATFADGGNVDDAGETSLAFSDSTYVYIVSSVFAPAVGTMQYKAIATWIDNYDDTNPSVEPYQSSTKDINFDSRLNYQKIYLQDELTFNSPGIQAVSHDLNKLANFRVFFESFDDEVWPMHAGNASNPFLYDSDMCQCTSVMTSTNLLVSLDATPTPRRAWYKIYLDS